MFGRNTTGGVIQVVTRDPSAETSGEARAARRHLRLSPRRRLPDRRKRPDRRQPRGEPVAQRRLRNEPLHRRDRPGRGRPQLRCAQQVDLAAGDVAEADLGRRTIRTSTRIFRFRPVRRISADRPAAASQDFRDGDQDAPNRYRFRYGGVSLKADAEIGSLTLMSLSALRRMHARSARTSTRGRSPDGRRTPNAEQDQFSQEFQLQSNEASRVRWVAGPLLHPHRRAVRPDPSLATAAAIRRCSAAGSGRPCSMQRDASSYAAYGQGTLPIGQATAADAGPALHDRGPLG